MGEPEDDRPIAQRGPRCRVVYAVRLDGSSPALEFVEGLGPGDLAKLANLFRRLAEFGEIRNREKFRFLHGTDRLFEFKSFQIRIPCFRDADDWVLTHGFIKKDDRTKPSEIERAKTILAEDEARIGRIRKGRCQ